jgi:hypothetical protein
MMLRHGREFFWFIVVCIEFNLIHISVQNWPVWIYVSAEESRGNEK